MLLQWQNPIHHIILLASILHLAAGGILVFDQDEQCPPTLEMSVIWAPLENREGGVSANSNLQCCSHCADMGSDHCVGFSYEHGICDVFEEMAVKSLIANMSDATLPQTSFSKSLNLFLRPPDTNATGVFQGRCAPTGVYWIPHETDCSRYTHCIFGNEIERNCPDCQLFDEPILACVPEDRATCAPGAVPPPINPCVDVTSAGLYAHPKDCRNYFFCLGDGTGIEAPCPGLQLFDTVQRRCRPPSDATCAPCAPIPVIITTPEPTTGLPDPSNECIGEEDGYSYGHPYDCRIFYACFAEVNYEGRCPPGQHFDIMSSFCRPTGEATCRSGATTPQDTIEPTTELPDSSNECIGKEDGYSYGHLYDCRIFYGCYADEVNYEGRCTAGRHFDIVTSLCLPPAEATCRAGATIPP